MTSTSSAKQIADGVAVLGAVQPMHASVGAAPARASAALSIVVSRCATSASSAACGGRGMPAGGIMPARTLRITFLPHLGARGDVVEIETPSSARPPVFASLVVTGDAVTD